jgi:BlaR1 peptidase M56
MERCSRSFLLRPLPELLVSDKSVSPFSVRLPRLSIFLPKDLVRSLTDEEIEQVLMHELAHIARRDQYWLILQRLAESAFWFVPTVFLNGRLLHEARERICDNHVLQHHAGHSYGATLLKLAESLQNPATYRAATQIASGRPNWLRRRVAALVASDRDIEIDCTVRTRIMGFAVLMVASLGMGLFSLSGISRVEAQTAVDGNLEASTTSSEKGTKSPLIVFTGIVLDANNNPVSNAQVILDHLQEKHGPIYSATTTTTDKAGKFSIEGQRIKPSVNRYLWAYSVGHSVRCVKPVEGHNRMILPPEEIIRVSLGSSLPSDLTVRPYYYEVPNGRYTSDEPSGLSSYVPPLLCDQLQWHPDEDGTVAIKGITRKLLNTIVFESKEFGQQTAPPVETVFLRETGRITGHISCPPGQLPGDLIVYVTVDLTLTTGLGTGHSAQAVAYRRGRTAGIARATVDANGRFNIDAIASGKARIQVDWPASSTLQPRLVNEPSDLIVKAGEELAVRIAAVEGIAVRGRIVTGDTGVPVDGAKVVLQSKDDRRLSSSHVLTDSDGWYDAYVLPGSGTLQCYGLPTATTDLPGDASSTYEYPSITDHEFESTKDGPLILEEVRLKPKEVVNGVLLDESGEPVSNRIIAMTHQRWGFIADMGKTDVEGRFQWTLSAYHIARLQEIARSKPEPEKESSLRKAPGFDSLPRFVLLPDNIGDVSDLKQITKAMEHWQRFPQAQLVSDSPLKLKLLSE